MAAFDVDANKVGSDLSEALFRSPNCAKRFSDVPFQGVPVHKSPVFDGIAPHMRNSFNEDSSQQPIDIVEVLRSTGAEMLICYLPVGSYNAARHFAEASLEAGVAFINAIPEFISSSPEWNARFKTRGIPCVGDDIKSQVGSTLFHRMITELIQKRGCMIDSMYQLNVGGNTDFANMRDMGRLASKRVSKTQAITSLLKEGSEHAQITIGPSDYIPHLKDEKVAYINVQGRQFGDQPFSVEIKLNVQDSPNSAGIMVDVIRAVKLSLDRNLSGEISVISSFAFKSPAEQLSDAVAIERFRDFISNERD
ncbi:MAG: inositol-3-phosphate synthase [Chthoniobacter sp.]|nr:inositol-3-phosphate synthase [Chthoniobacter sp.]